LNSHSAGYLNIGGFDGKSFDTALPPAMKYITAENVAVGGLFFKEVYLVIAGSAVSRWQLYSIFLL
jgi:hypothetical protein